MLKGAHGGKICGWAALERLAWDYSVHDHELEGEIVVKGGF